jgi:peptidoglycan/xylan/chitin deacetylase (PgdA/CDA1 family)
MSPHSPWIGRHRLLIAVAAVLCGAALAELSARRPRSAAAGTTVRDAARSPSHAVGTTALAATAPNPMVPPAVAPEPLGAAREGDLATSVERALGADYKSGMVITGVTHHRLILFTFDDGPDPRTTPLLLDRLDDAGIKAVFFLVASRIALTTPIEREQAQLAREIVRRGHHVGGHTIDHVQLPLLDDDAVRAEVKGAEDIFMRALGARPWILRPPFGAHSQRVDQLLAQRGYTVVLWNLGGEDFQVHTAQEVYQTWLRGFDHGRKADDGRGGIILLHDIHPWSVDAFQMIVAHLLARNCELLDKNEELFDFVDDLRFFYVARGSAAAETEAPPAEPEASELAARQAVLREQTARRCKSMAQAF